MKRKTKNSKSRFMFYKNDKNKLYNQLMNSQKPSYMIMIERSPSAFEVRPWRAVICGSEVEEIGSSQHLKVVLVPCPRCSEFPREECLIRQRPEVGEWSLAQMEISAGVACCGGRIYRRWLYDLGSESLLDMTTGTQPCLVLTWAASPTWSSTRGFAPLS